MEGTPVSDRPFYQKPQVNLSCPLPLRMCLVSLCAAAAVVQSALHDGGASLIICLYAVFAALLTESLIGLKTGRQTISDGSAITTALILSILLPNNIPPVFAAAGAVFAIAVIKMSYGGLGGNWINPALGGWLFIRMSWPEQFSFALKDSPLVFLNNRIASTSGDLLGSPMEVLAQNGGEITNGAITSFLNQTVFKIFGMEYPSFYLDFFNAHNANIIADRGIYALLISSIIIVALGVSRFSISAVYLVCYLALIKVFGALQLNGKLLEGDMLFGIFTGGTLAVALFLLVEPASSPKTGRGKVIAALVAAMLSFFFRYIKNEPYGAFFAIALVNIFVPLIRSIESALIYNKALVSASSLAKQDKKVDDI
jgi:electron transport complex protein RnfD